MDQSPFFDLSLDLLAIADTGGRFVQLNAAWEQVLGWTRAELLGSPYLEFVHPDDRAATMAEASKLAAGHRTAQFENRYRRKNGGYLWLQWNAELRPQDGLIYNIARDVTRARRLSLNLREIQDITRVGAWEIDLETNDLYWSDATHRIHETDPATYQPKLEDGIRFYAPEAVPALTAAVAGLMRQGTPYQLELPFITARGRRIWVRATGRSELANGKPVRVFGTFEDVTAEREERTRLQAFKDIVDLAGDGICVVDPAGCTLYANRRMARMLALPDEGALLGRSLLSFVAEDWTTPVRALLVPGGTGTGRLDFQMRCADGAVLWVAASVRLRNGPDGGPVSAIMLLRDITERKQIDLELQASRRRLEEAQTIARLGHWEANLATGQLYWSDVIFDIFGLDKAMVTPSLDVFNAALHPDDVGKVRASEEQAARTGIHDVEHRIIRPDGEMRWVRELARMHPDPEGRPVRLIGTVQDITAQKRVMEALDAARQAAETASRAKSTFLATMSHELRTPLNAIIGFSEIIREGIFGSVSPPVYREYAGHVHDSACHLLEIINDVLDLAKIEAQAITLNPQRLVVAEKVRRAVQTVLPLADRRGVSIHAGGDGDLAIHADRRATLQALFNILSNAVHHSPAGARVDVAYAAAGDGFAVITIRDHGPGFTADVLRDLGQPYPGHSDSYRATSRSTGLGFAITAALLTAMGGEIQAHNNPDRGATVTLRLPLATGA